MAPCRHGDRADPGDRRRGQRGRVRPGGTSHAEGCGGGWWRDRREAAERLRDSLVPFAAEGLPGRPGPVDLVLVVEGRARDVGPVPGVRVEAAAGSGDDRIVELAAEAADAPSPRPCVVVTADRELRRRVEAYGAVCTGPRTVRPLPPPSPAG